MTLEHEPQQPTPKSALGILFLIVFTDLLGFGIIIPLLPFIAKATASSSLAVTALFSIYSLCQLVGAPWLGGISDRHGRRPVLVVSQAGSVAGYLLLALATFRPWNPALALTMIYLSRIIDGLSGGNISTAQAYVSDITIDENRAKGMGVLGAAFGIGFTIGPALGGLLGYFGAFWPALAAAACSGIATLLSYYKLPEPPVHKGHAGEQKWAISALRGRPVLTQLLLIGSICMAAFVMMEATFALFLSRNDTFRFGEWQVGLIFALAGLIIVIVQGGLIGRLTKALGEWPLAIAGPILVAAGMTCFTITGFHAILWILLLGTVVNAGGRSFQQPTISSLISKFAAREQQGAVFGLFHGMMSLARIIGPLIAGIVYDRYPTGPYVTAGAIAVAAGLWTIVVRVEASHSKQAAPAPQ